MTILPDSAAGCPAEVKTCLRGQVTSLTARRKMAAPMGPDRRLSQSRELRSMDGKSAAPSRMVVLAWAALRRVPSRLIRPAHSEVDAGRHFRAPGGTGET